MKKTTTAKCEDCNQILKFIIQNTLTLCYVINVNLERNLQVSFPINENIDGQDVEDSPLAIGLRE